MDEYHQKLLSFIFIVSLFAFLQCSCAYPKLNEENHSSKRLYVCGWPYVAVWGTITKSKVAVLPDGQFWNFSNLLLNCLFSVVLIAVCHTGITKLVIPKAPRFQLVDLFATVAGVSFATAYMCGYSPPVLQTGVYLVFSVAEITIFDRTFLQRTVLAIVISLTGYTLFFPWIAWLTFEEGR